MLRFRATKKYNFLCFIGLTRLKARMVGKYGTSQSRETAKVYKCKFESSFKAFDLFFRRIVNAFDNQVFIRGNQLISQTSIMDRHQRLFICIHVTSSTCTNSIQLQGEFCFYTFSILKFPCFHSLTAWKQKKFITLFVIIDSVKRTAVRTIMYTFCSLLPSEFKHEILARHESIVAMFYRLTCEKEAGKEPNFKRLYELSSRTVFVN